MQSARNLWLGALSFRAFGERVGNRVQGAAALAAVYAAFALTGCGMPGAPQPPSLNLPTRVSDLSALRTGAQVALTWTMPNRNTDKTPIKTKIAVRVCRNPYASAPCTAINTLQLIAGANGAYTDTLPAPLAEGAPRLLTYYVELDNRKGRSAGLSNGSDVLAGAAPAAVTGLTAELRPDGVMLSWAPAPGSASAAIRLERKLLTPPAKKAAPQKGEQSPFAQAAEPIEQTLLVEAGGRADRALDTHIRFGETYEYRAQRVTQTTVDGKNLELVSALSSPVSIDAVNVFPPAVPRALAAVATPAENGAGPSIDLNWLPDSSADLAGYIVYRRDQTSNGAWQRISPAQPVVGPGYHDADVEPGHTYAYTVSAIGQNGRESAHSTETQETVPAQ